MSESIPSIDDLLIDLCDHWERGVRVRIETLLHQHSAQPDTQGLLDLIYKEVLLREDSGESPTLEEYLTRFPHLREELEAQFEVHRLIAEDAGQRATKPGVATEPTVAGEVKPPTDPLPVIPGYEVLGILASGGMGVIYKARQVRLNRFVAIKVIRPERLNSPGAVRRFQREALAAARLAHPYVVHVFDANQTNGLHYLVMEYVEGIDLAQLVARRGPLPVPHACSYIRQAALGLQHALERGLVHRDIKPANLMLTNEGTIKVLDMGLARLQQPEPGEESQSHLTQAGIILGTPDYIAPEQVEDPHAADIRSDLYSLGCTLFYLLTGNVVYPGGSMIQKLDRHRWAPPPPLGQFRSDVVPEVSAILAKLLAKRPNDRFQTPAELAVALHPFVPVDRPSKSHLPPAGVREDHPTVPRSEVHGLPPGPSPGIGRQMLGHTDWVTAVAYTPDGRRCLSTSRDRTLRLWDLTTTAELGHWVVHAESVSCLAVTPDGKRAITGSRDKTLRLWDLATGQEVGCLVGHSGEVTTLAVSPDGRTVLSGSEDQTIRLWSLETGRELRIIGGTVAERHWDAVLCVAFTPDGRRALSGSRDRTLRLWDLSNGREIRCLRGPSLPIHCLAVAPDGRRALSGGGHTVRLWDLEKGELVRRYKAHQKMVLSVAYAADGSRAVSGSEDRTVRVWNLTSGEAQRLDGHGSWVTTVAFAPDGRSVLSGSADRTVCLWQLPRPAAVEIPPETFDFPPS